MVTIEEDSAMRNRSTRVLAAVAAGAMAGSLGLAGAGTPQAARASAGLAPGAAGHGTQLWVSRYNGPGRDDDSPAAVAAGPGGKRVFVTGSSPGAGAFWNAEFATVAYQASTGARLWVSRYDNPGGNNDHAVSVAVSPRGGRVFVTGWSSGAGPGGSATVAYNAATGARLWVTHGHPNQEPSSMAVAPDGKTVFITGRGSRSNKAANEDYVTVAYSAATGAPKWTRFYNGPGSGYDAAASVAISPSGTTVLVTGSSDHGKEGHPDLDYATVAYRAATGARLWVRRYSGPGNSRDEAISVLASPRGGRVFVTGGSATVAYRAATGTRLWVTRGRPNQEPSSMAVSPDGKTVFTTGTSTGVASHTDWATIAWNAATGARRWIKHHNGPANSEDGAVSVAVSPDGRTLYATGYSWLGPPEDRTAPSEYVTIAYRTATGARLWARHYQNDPAGQDGAVAVAVSPAGLVFVTGTSARANAERDYATIAYSG
jgi:WD40 repeat protein